MISHRRGKGFQGAMKRWGFGGLPASHGVSLTHRSLGATGARQDPGKVWKGKKMAGRMGGDRIMVKNLLVYQIDSRENCLLVKGAVPGLTNDWVEIRDAFGYKFTQIPPFPTFIPTKHQLPNEPSILRASLPQPALATKMPEDMDSVDPLLQGRFPLKLSQESIEKFENIRKKYRHQLRKGHVAEIIKTEFPEWLPTKQELIEEDYRDKQAKALRDKTMLENQFRQTPPTKKEEATDK